MEYFSSNASIQIKTEHIYKYNHNYNVLNIDISDGIHTRTYLSDFCQATMKNCQDTYGHHKIKSKKSKKSRRSKRSKKSKRSNNSDKSDKSDESNSLPSLFIDHEKIKYDDYRISTVNKVNMLGPFIFIFDTSYNSVPALGPRTDQIKLSVKKQEFSGGYEIIPYNDAFIKYNNEDYYCVYTVDPSANVFIFDETYYANRIIVEQFGSLREYYDNSNNYVTLFDSIVQNVQFLQFAYQITYNAMRKFLNIDGSSIKYINTNSNELISMAVRENPIVSQFIQLTREQQLMTVNKSGLMIQYMKDVDTDMYYLAINNEPEAIYLIPPEKQNNTMIEIALHKNGMLLEKLDVGDPMKIIALQNNGLAIQFIITNLQ